MDKKFKTYQEAVEYFNNSSTQAIKLGLDRIKSFLYKLNNPQNSLKIIHIAGTNGKGSVLKYLETVLIESGYTIGSFTSPHLIEYTERFTINGIQITQETFLEYVNQIYNLLNKHNEEPLTLFELLTVIGFKYFNDNNVDIALFEVGLGGRLDATNVIDTPLISIITNIDYDHTKLLGQTLPEIATEKAGIIKENSYFLTNKNNKAVNTLISIANIKNAKIKLANPENYIILKNNNDFTQDIYNLNNELLYSISMQGKHQQENSLISYTALNILKEIGYNISDNVIKKGFIKTLWPGRAQYFSQERILIDGAHNPNGADCLRKLIDENYQDYKLVWIIGILNTKDSLGILEKLIKPNDTVIFTQPDANNAFKSDELHKLAIQNNLSASIFSTKNLQEALKKVSSFCKEDTLIVISGSLYLVGEYLSTKSPTIYG